LISASNNYVYQNAQAGNYLVYTQEDYINYYYTIRALLLDGNGNPAAGWPNDGIAIIESAEGYYQRVFSAGLNENKLVCFIAGASYNGYRTLAQKLDNTGNRLWGENGLTLVVDDEWNMYQVTDAVYKDNISCLLHPDNNTSTYLQKISPTGELLFGATGTILDYEWNTVQDPILIQYTNGSYSVFWKGWEDQLGRICHRYVSPSGEVSDSGPLSIAVNPYGFWNLDTAENNNIGVIAYTDNNQYYYAKGDGIPLNSLWACRLNALPVSNDDPVQNPAVLSSHNYPNPFNPSTTIRFNLKETHPVKVEIFNAKGQLVRELLNEAKTAGEYDVLWNGTDNNGRSVASGIYLYKIQAGQYSNTKKMMLMN